MHVGIRRASRKPWVRKNKIRQRIPRFELEERTKLGSTSSRMTLRAHIQLLLPAERREPRNIPPHGILFMRRLPCRMQRTRPMTTFAVDPIYDTRPVILRRPVKSIHMDHPGLGYIGRMTFETSYI